MENIKIGDIVARKSYNCDINFKVVEYKKEGAEKSVILKGIEQRIIADAVVEDLVLINSGEKKMTC